MSCFDIIIKRVSLIQDFIDRVLQVQETQLIKSEKGVGSQISVKGAIHESHSQVSKSLQVTSQVLKTLS